MKNGTVLANNINMYYEIHGQESSPTLILIGGLTRDHSIWNNIIGELSQSFRVLIYDNRGTGQTDKPDGPYTTELLAEDLAQLMVALKIPSAHIVGHSMGGFAAQHLAAQYPQKVTKLMLCNTCIQQPQNGITYLTGRLQCIKENANLETMVRTATPWIFHEKYLTEGKIQVMINAAKSNPHPQPTHALQAQIHACINHDSSKIVNSIKAPTLVVTGETDKVMTREVCQHLTDQIPNATLKVLSDTAHMVQVEQPKEFCQTIYQFLLGE